MYLLMSLLMVAHRYYYACIIEKLITDDYIVMTGLDNKVYFYSYKKSVINFSMMQLEKPINTLLYLLLKLIEKSNLSLIRTNDLRRQLDLCQSRQGFDDYPCHFIAMRVVRSDYLRPYHLKTRLPMAVFGANYVWNCRSSRST